MNHSRARILIHVLLAASLALLLAACGGPAATTAPTSMLPAATATDLPATVTPVPPTATATATPLPTEMPIATLAAIGPDNAGDLMRVTHGVEGTPTGLAWAAAGDLLLAASTLGVQVFPRETGSTEVLGVPRPPLDFSGAGMDVDASMANRQAVLVGDDGVARLWDLGSGEMTPLAVEGASRAQFDRGGTRLVVAGEGGVHIIDPATGEESALLASGRQITALAAGPDGSIMVTTNARQQTLLWDIGDERMLNTLTATDDVLSIDIGGDGVLIATGTRRGLVRLWFVVSGELITDLPGHDGAVWDVAFNPDATLLATAGEDGALRLWDMVTGEAVELLAPGGAPLLALAWSPDGSLLAAADAEGALNVWRVP